MVEILYGKKYCTVRRELLFIGKCLLAKLYVLCNREIVRFCKIFAKCIQLIRVSEDLKYFVISAFGLLKISQK